MSKGTQIKVDEVCSGPIGGWTTVATEFDVRRTGVDEVLGAARSCFLSIVICKIVAAVAAQTLL